MTDQISAATLRQWLYYGDELALLDVREIGQIAAGHILFSAPLPYSRFELDLPALAPNPTVRMVLVDAGDGVAERAARKASAMGYSNVYVLQGGVASWASVGHTLYEGVNVPSKAFGELVELAEHTPRLTAEQVAAMQKDGADMVIVDGRPMAEYTKMNIPGASCCPNGELALRIGRIAPDPKTTVVVNCAGRTRSIIGAETLRGVGLPNPVYALENGTQGWTLAGLSLGSGNGHDLAGPVEDLSAARSGAQTMARRHGVRVVSAGDVAAMLGDGARTTYLLDVRTEEEQSADSAEVQQVRQKLAVAHAPGGQLQQATDQWIGVRNAQVVVLDTEEVRALVTASWLCRLGHDAMVVEGGLGSLVSLDAHRALPMPDLGGVPRISPNKLPEQIGRFSFLDLRASGAYRKGHIPTAVWTTRARLPEASGRDHIVMVADDDRIATLAAIDLRESGCTSLSLLSGGMKSWIEAGHATETSPSVPADPDRIDFIAHTHGRHDGDRAASLAYLAWEVGLVDQLDDQECAVFRI